LNNNLDKNHCIAKYDEMQAAYKKIWKLEQTNAVYIDVQINNFRKPDRFQKPVRFGSEIIFMKNYR